MIRVTGKVARSEKLLFMKDYVLNAFSSSAIDFAKKLNIFGSMDARRRDLINKKVVLEKREDMFDFDFSCFHILVLYQRDHWIWYSENLLWMLRRVLRATFLYDLLIDVTRENFLTSRCSILLTSWSPFARRESRQWSLGKLIILHMKSLWNRFGNNIDERIICLIKLNVYIFRRIFWRSRS